MRFATMFVLLACTMCVGADTVVYDVRGYTQTTSGLTRFNWLRWEETGRIIATGTGTPAPARTMIDGDQHVMLPGLIDAHGHVGNYGCMLREVDLTGTRSLVQAQNRIRAFALAHPGQETIIARGWNQEHCLPARFPSAADLDQTVAERPAATQVLETRIAGRGVFRR